MIWHRQWVAIHNERSFNISNHYFSGQTDILLQVFETENPSLDVDILYHHLRPSNFSQPETVRSVFSFQLN